MESIGQIGITGALVAAVVVLSKVVDFFLNRYKHAPDASKKVLDEETMDTIYELCDNVKNVLGIVGKVDMDGRPRIYTPNSSLEVQERMMELMREMSINLRDMSSIQKEILSTQKEILNITQTIKSSNDMMIQLDRILCKEDTKFVQK